MLLKHEASFECIPQEKLKAAPEADRLLFRWV